MAFICCSKKYACFCCLSYKIATSMIACLDIFMLLFQVVYYSIFFTSSLKDLESLEEIYFFAQFLVLDSKNLTPKELDALVGNLLMIDFSRMFVLIVKVSRGIDMMRFGYKRRDVNSFFMVSFAYYAQYVIQTLVLLFAQSDRIHNTSILYVQVGMLIVRNVIFNSIIYSFLLQKDQEQEKRKDDRDRVIYYMVLKKGHKGDEVKGVDKTPSNLLTTYRKDN